MNICKENQPEARKKIAAHTLGCKVNQQETEAILTLFRQKGYQVVDFRTPAQVYLVNTCTVTGQGDRKSRQIIRQAIQRHPDALVVVMGCYAQRAAQEILAIPGVALVLGNHGRQKVVEQVEQLWSQPLRKPWNQVLNIQKITDFEELPVPLEQGRTRAWVKIQDGCNQYCTYCIVPYTRGPVRSRAPEKVLQEIQQLAAAGFSEIVLTGIHTSAYGQEHRQSGWNSLGIKNLADLVECILRQVPKLPRLRISSLEPTEITEKLLELFTENSALCKHLHIPLQAGQDEILHQMGRKYTTAEYRNLVRRIRQRIPEVALTTDIMVGFPGETDDSFKQTCCFLQEIDFSALHVFKYSRRPGTPAANRSDLVSRHVQEERSARLLALGAQLQEKYARKFLQRELTILLEQAEIHGGNPLNPEELAHTTDGWFSGYTDTFIRVAVALDSPRFLPGQMVQVRPFDYQKGILLSRRISEQGFLEKSRITHVEDNDQMRISGPEES